MSLPDLYSRWIKALIDGPLPLEEVADCASCSMLELSEEHVTNDPYDGRFFNQETKCCTYHPFIPNFVVGQMLLAGAAPQSVLERIDSGHVSPIGIQRPRKYELLYRSSAADAFGKSETLQCPFYESKSGRCGVWSFRNSTCATWFCKHERGLVAARFWQSLRDLLSTVEHMLSLHCVIELGIPEDTLETFITTGERSYRRSLTLAATELDGVRTKADGDLWGVWAGREKAFFEKCVELVGDCEWPALTQIAGPDLVARSKIVMKRYEELRSHALPDSLKVGNVSLVASREAQAQIVSYSSYDPLEVPVELLSALPYFDGRPVKEALSAIAEELELEVEEDLVRMLFDYGVLVS